MRPVLSIPPLCTMKELQDATYTMADVLLMNCALDVREENERRAQDAANKRNKRS